MDINARLLGPLIMHEAKPCAIHELNQHFCLRKANLPRKCYRFSYMIKLYIAARPRHINLSWHQKERPDFAGSKLPILDDSQS